MNARLPSFSNRILELGLDQPENELTNLKNQFLTLGKSILDLTVSNPSEVGLEFPWSSILEDLDFSAFAEYNPNSQGLLTTREAIANSIYQSPCESDLVLTSGTSESLSYLLKLLTNPGDSVLVPAPGYPLFPYLCNLESVNCIEYPLVFDSNKGRWEYHFLTMKAKVKKNTKAVLLVTPNNPTGSFLTAEEWKEWEDWSIQNQIPLIIDTVFSEFAMNDSDELLNLPIPVSTQAPIFLLNGISKMLFLPQWKLAWIRILGTDTFRKNTKSALEFIADSYLSVNSFIQKKLPQLLVWKSLTQNQWKRRVLRNRAICKSFEWESVGFKFHFGKAGYYAYFDIPFTDSEAFCETILKQTRVLLHPGGLFLFPDRKERFVISMIGEERILEEGLSRIFTFCQEGKAEQAKPESSL